jgi:hypothetical protein
MEFTALFLAITIGMLIAWRGPRPLAIGLSAVTWSPASRPSCTMPPTG